MLMNSPAPVLSDGPRVTGDQSRTLSVGDRVCWQNDQADQGTVTEKNWGGVTIKWDNRGEQALVQEQGVLNTTVTLTGSSQIALARNPRPRGNTAVARPDPADPYAQQYNAAGEPTVLTPQQPGLGQSQYPQERPDDGYIYPADGSSQDTARYAAPRSSNRRLYAAQAYPQQRYYYDNRGYAPQVQYAPRPYYQPRGFFN